MTLQPFASVNLNSAAFRLSQQPTHTHTQDKVLRHFDALFALAEACAELRQRRLFVAARSFKDAAVGIVEQWLDGDITREDASERLLGLLADAQQVVVGDEITNMEQIAAARSHVSATLERWQAEDWDAEFAGPVCSKCGAPVSTGTLVCHDCIEKEKQGSDKPSVCAACEKAPHPIQSCPDLLELLFAPDDAELAAILAAMPGRTWPAPPDEAAIVARVSANVTARIAAMTADERLLATADPALCLLPGLQVAHDRLLLCTASPDSDEYHDAWQAYRNAGGDLTMRDPGIDPENWKRHTVNLSDPSDDPNSGWGDDGALADDVMSITTLFGEPYRGSGEAL